MTNRTTCDVFAPGSIDILVEGESFFLGHGTGGTTPNGPKPAVLVMIWTSAQLTNVSWMPQPTASVPSAHIPHVLPVKYFHWIMPREQVTPSGNLTWYSNVPCFSELSGIWNLYDDVPLTINGYLIRETVRHCSFIGSINCIEEWSGEELTGRNIPDFRT